MAVTIDGTTGITTPAEAVAGNLSYTGTLTGGTGVVNIGSGQVYKDASGNVGIGTTSPVGKFNVRSTYVSDTTTQLRFQDNTGVTLDFGGTGGGVKWLNVKDVTNNDAYPLAFQTGSVERARIDSSGNLLVGTTSVYDVGQVCINYPDTKRGLAMQVNATGNSNQISFRNPNGIVDSISTSASTTTYSTSSDYRLKNTIAPMTGALDKVALLKPCTYKWIVDGSDGQGFIAHELQEVVEGCVTGTKDAVDAEGNPQYQGIDTSFLVATLTAAIQEQQAIITALTTRITALEAK